MGCGPSSVEAVYQTVSRDRDLKETTISHPVTAAGAERLSAPRSDGRAYIYRALEPARSLAARAVRQIIDRFCQGSVEDLVSGMVEAKVLSKGEMDRLEEFIRGRQGGK